MRLLSGHHATVSITPGTISPVGEIGLQATSMTASLDIVPGTAPNFKVSVNGLAVTTPQGTVTIAALQFPFPLGFDITNPASLGISVTQREQLVLAFLVSELSSAFGSLGLATAVLFGAAAGAPGLPSDFPPLADPSGPGSLLTDPLSAVRTWIGKVATQLSSNGSCFFTAFIPWLEAWLSNQLPTNLTTPPNVPSLEGQGTYDDPWVLPLGAGSPASGLLWLEPEGPPSTASLAAAAVTAATSFDTLATALTGAARYLGATPPTALSPGLASLSTYLTSSDGVVPASSQVPTGGTWTSGTAIGSAHNLQAADPSAITQILAQVDSWGAPGSNRAILLLGPAFLDHTEWSALLTQAETARSGSTNAAATFNLRVSGVAPASIDLRPVTAIADYYTADLQDDGSGDIAGLSAQIGLLTARILALKPNAVILLVAHSTAGVPARAYTESNASQVKGLNTLGTPHLSAPLTPLTDGPTAEALRAIGTLLPNGLAPGPLTDALNHLRHALDGYLPPATAGALPLPFPYPYGDFAGSADTGTGGVPALALGGPLGGAAGVNLLSAMQAAASTAINGFTAKAPTHLAFGAKIALPLGVNTDVSARAAARLDAGRVALQTGAPDPPHPAHALSVDIAISRPGGWLAGGTLSFAGLGTALVDVRVRSAEFGAAFTLNGTALSAAPYARLTDAAFHGTTLPQVNWNDPQLAASLGSVFTGIAAIAPAAGSSLATLLSTLEALGICAANAGGGIGIAADAITALTADPLSFLSANASSALAAGSIPGFTAMSGGFSYTPAALPFELLVLTSPPTVGLGTTASQGLSLGSNAALTFSIALPLATMQPNISAGLQLGPATLNYSAGTLTLAVPPALSSLQLYPVPASATILAALESALPWLLVQVAGNAVLEQAVGRGFDDCGNALVPPATGRLDCEHEGARRRHVPRSGKDQCASHADRHAARRTRDYCNREKSDRDQPHHNCTHRRSARTVAWTHHRQDPAPGSAGELYSAGAALRNLAQRSHYLWRGCKRHSPFAAARRRRRDRTSSRVQRLCGIRKRSQNTSACRARWPRWRIASSQSASQTHARRGSGFGYLRHRRRVCRAQHPARGHVEQHLVQHPQQHCAHGFPECGLVVFQRRDLAFERPAARHHRRFRLGPQLDAAGSIRRRVRHIVAARRLGRIRLHAGALDQHRHSH